MARNDRVVWQDQEHRTELRESDVGFTILRVADEMELQKFSGHEVFYSSPARDLQVLNLNVTTTSSRDLRGFTNSIRSETCKA